MSRTLGQQVVVENRAAGGGGTVATRAVAKAAPDGYTILLTYTGTLAVNPTLYPNAGYDPRKDFAPIGLIGAQPSVLTLHPSLPVHSTAELVAYAKANPNKINCGFVPGTIGHMTTELFAKNAGFEITRVPYKGNGTAIGDLIGGHITMMVLSIQTVVGNVKAGKLRALAVTTAERSKLMPDVPTISELAVPGFSAAIRYGLAAPAGTPRPIIEQAEPGAARRGVVRRDARTPGARGRRADRQHAGGIRRRDRCRGDQVVGHRQKPQPENRVA